MLMTLPNRIREWRAKRRLTLEELGDLVNLDGSYIGKMERGDSSTTVDHLLQIARALNCHAADLLPQEPIADAVDRPANEAQTSTGFEFAETAGLHVTPWPIPIRADGDGYSPHGCAWFGAGFLGKFDIDPSRCEVIEVRSHAMQRTMPYGSACLVDRSRTYLRHGALYCLERDGEPLIRRAEERRSADPRWVFLADDTSLPPLSLGGDFQMVGRVVWTARMLNVQ